MTIIPFDVIWISIACFTRVMQFFNSIYSIGFTVNINKNKAGVITQTIPRYTSEYYGNLNFNYKMQKMLDKAGVEYIPQVRTNRGRGLEILLGLNRVN